MIYLQFNCLKTFQICFSTPIVFVWKTGNCVSNLNSYFEPKKRRNTHIGSLTSLVRFDLTHPSLTMTRPSNGSLDLCSEEMSQALDILKQDAETVRQILHTYGAHLQTAYDKIKDLSFLEQNAPEFLNDITRIKGRASTSKQSTFCFVL